MTDKSSWWRAVHLTKCNECVKRSEDTSGPLNLSSESSSSWKPSMVSTESSSSFCFDRALAACKHGPTCCCCDSGQPENANVAKITACFIITTFQ